jgi:hypothetical protein
VIYYVTIDIPGLEASVRETIDATNYAQMLSSAQYLKAAVERINCSEHTALDVLFAFINSLDPAMRNWPYEAEDDWLLLDNLTLLAAEIKRLASPLMPMGGIPSYHSHTDETLTMLIRTSQGYNYAF